MDDLVNKLAERLEEHGLYLDYEKVESIAYEFLREHKDEQNVGVMLYRTKNNPREKAFSEQWHEDNKIKTYMNYGNGLLQDLFVQVDKDTQRRRLIYEITKNDRAIVATVIQWLGTNIGFSFLESALLRCGYRITKIKP